MFSVFIFNLLAVYNFDPNPVDCLQLVPGKKHSYVAVFVGSDNVLFIKHTIEAKQKCGLLLVVV